MTYTNKAATVRPSIGAAIVVTSIPLLMATLDNLVPHQATFAMSYNATLGTVAGVDAG